MSDYEAIEPEESEDDLWHVQLGTGDVIMMTLEELDESFQAGRIHENTYLWQEGATGWVTLREVAGLDADEEPASQHANPFVQADHVSDSVWPSAPAVPSFGYPAQDIYAPPLQHMGPHSTAPVVSPLRGMEFDLDEVDFGKKKRSGGRWLFAAALIGAAGFGATKYKLLPFPQASSTQLTNAIAASPVPAVEVAPTPPPAAPAPVATTAPAAPAQPAAPAEPVKVIPDDVKQRLAAADKALSEKQKAKQQQLQQRHAASSTRSRSRPAPGANPFHKGGDVGDPLNSSL